MDLVTLTDHDSIGGAESLLSRPGTFLNEEVTCTAPSGTELHVGVYGISEGQHIQLQRRRSDLRGFPISGNSDSARPSTIPSPL
jgi:hypothetical protein